MSYTYIVIYEYEYNLASANSFNVRKMEKSELFKISKENAVWLKENYAHLKREYDKCWIVIQDKKVVKCASTFDEIMRTVRKHDPNRILVEYIQSEPVAMFF